MLCMKIFIFLGFFLSLFGFFGSIQGAPFEGELEGYDPCQEEFLSKPPLPSFFWSTPLIEEGLDLRIGSKFKELPFLRSYVKMKKDFERNFGVNDCQLSIVELGMRHWNDRSGYSYFQLPAKETESKQFKNPMDYTNDDITGIYYVSKWFPGERYKKVVAITARKYDAYTKKLITSDILFNGTLKFTMGSLAMPHTYDFYTVLLHELGHFLGLTHVDRGEDSVMLPNVYPGYRSREVSDLDVANLNYPSQPPPLFDDTVRRKKKKGRKVKSIVKMVYLKDDGKCSHYENGVLVQKHQLF